MTAPVPMLENAASQSELAALDVKVGNLDSDVREINDRLLGLDTKIDKAVASLATEFRSALASLAAQLSERNRTPWAVLISGAGFIVAVLGVVGSQALSPLQSEIKSLKEQIVPREEINFRSASTQQRLDRLDGLATQLQNRRYEEMQRSIDRLERQLDAAKAPRL